MHELRNSLGSATLAVAAMQSGNLALSGSTGAVLKRSLGATAGLIDRSLQEARTKNGVLIGREVFPSPIPSQRQKRVES